MIRYCIVLLLASLLVVKASAQKQPLYPYWDTTGKWGYSDSCAKVVIQPQWEQVSFFRGGKAFVQPLRDRAEYGVVDPAGRYIVPASWHWDLRWFGWDSTALNVHDDNGNYGLADSNGHLVIPLLYQPYYDGVSMPYCTRNVPWSRPVMACKKNDKVGIIDTFGHTLIPFMYDRIFLHNFGYLHNAVHVQKDGKWTFVDTFNHPLLATGYDEVVPNKNDTSGIVVVSNSKSAYLDYPSLRVRIPFRYRYLSPVGSIFIAIDSNNRYGIIDRQGKILMPFDYTSMTSDTGHIYVEKQKLVKVNSSRPAPYIVMTDAGGRPCIPETYRRSFDVHTLEPVSGWEYVPNLFDAHDHWVCGYGAHMAHEMVAWENARPKVSINGKYEPRYQRDSIEWFVTHRESHLGNYALVHGHNIYRAGPEYYSVVDYNANTIVAPTTRQIVSYNAADSLITVAVDDKYGIMDAHQHLVLPFQSRHIDYGFRWKHKVYAYVKSCPDCSSVPVLMGADDLSFEEFRMRRFPHLDINSPKKGLGFILNSDTQVVNRFNGYEFVSLATPDGRSLTNSAGPCFWVRDTTGHVGLVSPVGTVLYPKISFRYKYCIGAGDGIFFVRPDDGGSLGKVLNSKGEEMLPGLAVSDIHRAQPTYNKPLPNGGSSWQAPPIPGIYQVTWWFPGPRHQEERTLYMSRTGIIFSNLRLKTSHENLEPSK